MNNVAIANRIEAPCNWEAALSRLRVAEQVNRQYFKEVYSPAVDHEKAFEKTHGLDPSRSGYVERRKALEAKHRYRIARSIEETADRLCNEACAADDELMQTPSPDLKALRFKLERILATDDSGTEGWSADYVQQTVEDMRRLLK